MGRVTFWAIFSQTHLVTLLKTCVADTHAMLVSVGIDRSVMRFAQLERLRDRRRTLLHLEFSNDLRKSVDFIFFRKKWVHGHYVARPNVAFTISVPMSPGRM
jgi:hypothetical protein